MQKLAAFYFSGTGNTRYVTEKLCATRSSADSTLTAAFGRICDG